MVVCLRSGAGGIVGALANLGHEVSDQTVGNVLLRHGVPPAPERKHTTTWATFIRAHLAVLAGTDFVTVEVFTPRGLATYYVLFFIHLGSRKADIAGTGVISCWKFVETVLIWCARRRNSRRYQSGDAQKF